MSPKVRQRTILKALARTWGEWRSVEITAAMRAEHPLLKYAREVFANNRFELHSFSVPSSIGGVTQISISRHGQIEDVTWEEAQRAVHELFGPEVTAIEVYPPIEHEWRNASGQTARVKVLWILPSTWPIPFGLHLRGAWGVPQ